MISNNTSDFDICLEYGEIKQKQLAAILGDETLEVKSDRKAKTTGNIAIEYRSRGKPSGLATTRANFWVFILDGMGMFIGIATDKLRKIARGYYIHGDVVKGGDDNTSDMVLVPVKALLPARVNL